MSTCYHPAHGDWESGFPVDLGGATEPYALPARRERTKIPWLRATLQEILGHEGWGYGAHHRAQNEDKAGRVDDGEDCHGTRSLARAHHSLLGSIAGLRIR